jgi:hypothetical protein
MQFIYLLRELKEGTHIDYGPKEHIPMEYANTLPPAVCLQPYDRVHFPNRPEEVSRSFNVHHPNVLAMYSQQRYSLCTLKYANVCIQDLYTKKVLLGR